MASTMLSRAVSMNVDWLPNDENAPLPLSTTFRSSLRRLCILVEGKGKMPPEIIKKRDVIVSMCKKLDEDEANIKAAETGGGLKLSVFLGLIGVAIFATTSLGDWVINTLERVKSLLPRGGKKRYAVGRRLGHSEDDSDRMTDDIVRATLKSQDDMREARLRAFERKEVEVLAPTLPGTEDGE